MKLDLVTPLRESGHRTTKVWSGPMRHIEGPTQVRFHIIALTSHSVLMCTTIDRAVCLYQNIVRVSTSNRKSIDGPRGT